MIIVKIQQTLNMATPSTKLPVFIGYSEFSKNKTQPPIAQRVHSLSEFECLFGGPASFSIVVQLSENNKFENYVIRKNFLLYDSVKQFFLMGGESACIISVGGYEQTIKQQGLLTGLAVIESLDSIRFLLIPDATSITEKAPSQKLNEIVTALCAEKNKLLYLSDQQEDPCNPKHQKPIYNEKTIERIDSVDRLRSVSYSPWIKSKFSTEIKFRDLKFSRSGVLISLNAIAPSDEEKELIDELEEAIDNAKRISLSIKRRQRGDDSLTNRFQILLTNYLRQPAHNEENMSLYILLQFLKSLVEMLNHWICACALDEVLSGDMNDIVRQTIIPEIANQALPDLINLHHQAIDLGWIDTPSVAYQEMFCLTSCIGNTCPWQQSDESTRGTLLSHQPAENEVVISKVFENLEEAINVVIELAEQFECDAQEALLEESPALRLIFSVLQQSRYIPSSAVVAAVVNCDKKNISLMDVE